MTSTIPSDARTNPPSLEARVARLEAVDAIRALKARYAGLADAKYTSDYQRQPEHLMREIARQQAECFTDNAIWVGGSGFGDDLVGRERLCDWFEHFPWRFAMHYYVSEAIDIDDGTKTASATWRLWQLAIRADTAHAVLLGAITAERYERDPSGNWLISEMRFLQLQMMEPTALTLPLASDFAELTSKRIATSISR